MMTWIAFLSYVAVTLVLGWLAHQRRDRGEAFWTAGRSLGGISVGLSISAGFMSVSWSCVYAVQLFYWYGLGAVWLITIPWLIALTGIYFLARRYHDLSAFSQPEMVAQRFGTKTKRMTALALAFVFLVWGGAEIYVAGTLLAPGLDIPVGWVIFIISAVVGVYATMGGFRAVVMTDKLQYAIVALYILAMAWLAGKGLSEVDMSAIKETVTAAKSGVSWSNVLAPGLVTILLTLAAYLPGWLFETDLWLRVQAAKDGGAARRGVVLAGINGFFFVGILPMFIGIAALFIFPMEGNGSTFPSAIGNEGDAIFSALAARFAPGWMSVLFSVGLVAAAMSTIDTCVNVMALSLGYDMGEIHKKRHAERWSKIVTIASVLMAFLFALNTESLWDIFYLSSGILTTSVAFPVAAVFIKKANREGVFWSSVFGFGGTILFYFLESKGLLNKIEPKWMLNSGLGYILWGMIFAAIGYTMGTFLKQAARRVDLE
ncbi:MAG: sodium:solute symporter family protein [bacterium]|nr:sodium:solute symporter family protein [bacterium]